MLCIIIFIYICPNTGLKNDKDIEAMNFLCINGIANDKLYMGKN